MRRSFVRFHALAAVILSTFTGFAAAQDEQKKIDPTGTWTWSREFQGQKRKSKLVLKQKDGKLNGTLTMRDNDVAIENGKLDGKKLSFEVVREFNDQEFTLAFQGEVSGDKITGVIAVGEREIEWEATREVAVAGTWKLELNRPDGGVAEITLSISEKDGKLTAQYESPFGEFDIEEVKADGKKLSFQLDGERDGFKFTVNYEATVDGDSMSGKAKFDFDGNTGELDFSGKRAK